MNRNQQMVGIFFILLGLFFLLAKMELIPFSLFDLWPFFLVIPGLAFHFFGFLNRIPGLHVPGGILTTIGILFLFTEFFGYGWMEHLWPIFIIAPGIGLLELYLFGTREKGLLIPVVILFSVGGFFLFFTLFSTFIPYLVGFLLIVLGVYMIFGNRRRE
ncbi:LiaI-LiaF-like domain-containing protein [Thermicanus aegyptius]|uniref:LiaI-LiaF-like domain-containing protein n=1 Tax=Thermicanus aegyptius TaxID=94009 RepID=UPI0003F72B49|nr:DUF5668 domain-containing protein [Thermicanus aegyptius]